MIQNNDRKRPDCKCRSDWSWREKIFSGDSDQCQMARHVVRLHEPRACAGKSQQHWDRINQCCNFIYLIDEEDDLFTCLHPN